MSPNKRQKNGVSLAIAMVVVYIVVLLGTLKYTGVIQFPGGQGDKQVAEKKSNVSRKADDTRDKSGPTTTARAAETGNQATSTTAMTATTMPPSTTTTRIMVPITTTTVAQESGEKLKKLVDIYESMDAGQAAEILTKLSDNEVVSILMRMDEEIAAEVLASMDTARAAALSKQLGL